jgi:cell division protein FtsN
MRDLLPDSYFAELITRFGGTSTTPEPARDRRVAEQRRQLVRLDSVDRRRAPRPVMPWGIGDPSVDPYC